jgi:hypothetical protein
MEKNSKNLSKPIAEGGHLISSPTRNKAKTINQSILTSWPTLALYQIKKILDLKQIDFFIMI